MEISYYYKHEADQFSFIRIPKMMMTEELFASLSLQAKILYTVFELVIGKLAIIKENLVMFVID